MEKETFKSVWAQLNKTIEKLEQYPKRFFRFEEYDIYNGTIESVSIKDNEFHLSVLGLDKTRTTYRKLIDVVVSYKKAVKIFSIIESEKIYIESIIRGRDKFLENMHESTK